MPSPLPYVEDAGRPTRGSLGGPTRAGFEAVNAAHAYRGFAGEHPGLYASLLPVPRADTDPDGAAAAAEPVGVVAGALAELGITPDRHIDLIRTLRATLHGFVDLENGDGFGLAQPVDASFDAALDLVVGALSASGRTGTT